MAVSLLIHASLVLLAFDTLKGAVVSGGSGVPDGDVGAVTISLAGLRGGHEAASAPPAAVLQTLFEKIRAQQSELPVSPDKPQPRPRTDLQKMFEVVDQEQAAKDQVAGKDGRSQLDDGGRGASAKAEQADAPDRKAKPSDVQRPGGPGADVSTGDLWGQIKPCWDGLPAVATVPVTLVVTLDDQGRIATPPKIVRPSALAPNEKRLVSEARALAAVTACVPYRAMGLLNGKRVFEVRFGGAS